MRQLLVRVFPRLESNIGKSNASNGVGAGGGGCDAGRNTPRSGTHQYQWHGQSRGVNGRNRGPRTRAMAAETESEREIVLGSFRRSAGSNDVEVLEVDDVERESADGRILASSSMDSTEKREGFGLSIVGCWTEDGGRVEPEGFPSSRR